MKILVTLLLMLAITDVQASSLEGRWKCQMTDDSDDRVLTFSTLEIDSSVEIYERNGDMKFFVGGSVTPIIHMKSYEHGVLSLEGDQLKISPLETRLSVIESGPIDKVKLENEVSESLKKEEIATIVVDGKSSFTMKHVESGQFDTCVREKKKI